LRYWINTINTDLQGKRTNISYSSSANPLFKLPAGKYHVRAKHGDAYAETEVEVSAGTLKEQNLVLDAGYLKLTAANKAGEAPIKDDLRYWINTINKDLQGKRSNISYSSSANPLFKLPAGRYHLRVKHGDAYAETEVEVKAGELTEQRIVLNAGYLKLTTSVKPGEAALQRGLRYWVNTATEDINGKHQNISYSSNAAPVFKLAAGDYQLVIRHGDTQTTSAVSIAAGETREVNIVLNP
jgi:Ca-activated chloride channel family protein